MTDTPFMDLGEKLTRERERERAALSGKSQTTGSVSALKEQLIPLFETGDFRGICLSKGIDRDRQMLDCADIVIQTLELLEKKQNDKVSLNERSER